MAQARGDVKCNKLPYRFSSNPKWPVIDGYKNINVCSSAQGIWKQLSPMLLGPVEFTEFFPHGVEEIQATNLENYWQSAKVWEGEVDAKGNPNEEWYQRRRKICADPKAHRHIKKGKGPNRNVPLFAWWDGQHMTYDEARRKKYIPMYMKLVRKTEAWKRLEGLVNSGQNIQLLGYDGRVFDDLNKELKDLSKPFGHELVLCAMLLDVKLDL